jgi:hypothetical protein
MKTTIKIMLTVLAVAITFVANAQSNAGGTLIPTTSVYVGNKTLADYQKELSVLDAEVTKLEAKRDAELDALAEAYKDNMPVKGKPSKLKVKKSKGKLSDYEASLLKFADSTTTNKPTVTTTTTTDAYTLEKANYDAAYEAAKSKINAKYEALIAKIEANREIVLANMVGSSDINYVASTTSADKAGNLYIKVKAADNLGNTGSSTVSTGSNGSDVNNGGGVVMLVIHNTSNYTITVNSAPFTGTTLAPGQVSVVPQAVNVGLYPLVYTKYYNNSSPSITKYIGITQDGGAHINIPN